METYFWTFAGSRLPLPPLAVGAIFVALAMVDRRIAARSREVLASQAHVVLDDPAELTRMDRPGAFWPAFALYVALMVLAWFVGESLFAFVAGGMVLMLAMMLGLNLHSLAFAQRLARGQGVAGSLTLSAGFVFEDLARRASTCALVYLLAGLALAHIAPIGGAAFLWIVAIDLSRRGRTTRAT